MVVTLEIIYSLCEEIGLMLSLFFNPIQDKPFWGCSRIGGGGCEKRFPLSKTWDISYKDVISPYLKKTQKTYESRAHHLSSADISIFHRK